MEPGREGRDRRDESGEQRDTIRPRWSIKSRDGIWSGLPGIEDILDDDDEPAEGTEPEIDREPVEGVPEDGAGDATDGAEAPAWWQRHADRARPREQLRLVPKEYRPAPFRAEVARRVPDHGTRKEKASGAVDLHNGRVVDIISGAGPADSLPKPRPGMHGSNRRHVEAHTAAIMRTEHIMEATLYISKVPCRPVQIAGRRRLKGCDELLGHMLAERAKLTVYGPGDFCRVYRGRPDSESKDDNA